MFRTILSMFFSRVIVTFPLRIFRVATVEMELWKQLVIEFFRKTCIDYVSQSKISVLKLASGSRGLQKARDETPLALVLLDACLVVDLCLRH